MKVQFDLTLDMLNIIDSAVLHYHNFLTAERHKIANAIGDALDNCDSSIADCYQEDLDYHTDRIELCKYVIDVLNHL